MVRLVRPGGIVAAYVWDYAGKMRLMRDFWDGHGGAVDRRYYRGLSDTRRPLVPAVGPWVHQLCRLCDGFTGC